MPNLPETTTYNKKLFLEKFPTFVSITDTANAMGISRAIVFDWVKKDKAFKLTLDTLKKLIQEKRIEEHEKNIHDIALDTNTPAQSRIFGSLCILRANDPNKWREKANAIPISGELKVILSVPPYSDDVKAPILIKEGSQDGQHSEKEDEALP